MNTIQNNRITSLREATKFIEINLDKDMDDQTIGAQVKCRGCGASAYFADGTIESLYEFATRHQVCTEIKKELK